MWAVTRGWGLGEKDMGKMRKKKVITKRRKRKQERRGRRGRRKYLKSVKFKNHLAKCEQWHCR